MILDRRDMELLLLAGEYRWLPYGCFDTYGFADLNTETELLASAGLIIISRNKQYFRLSPRGYELLQNQGYSYEAGTKRAYAGSTALRRRLEVAQIMLTCRRAGIDTRLADVYGLKKQPAFFPAFRLRSGNNLMNAASCAGFGHWGDKAYMLQYVSPDSPGMYLTNELAHLHNLASIFDRSLNTQSALIFAGPSYKQVYEQLHNAKPSQRHGVKGFCDFSEAYRKADIPIHLLSCDETGAMQLAVTRQADHKAKIARAAFGARWALVDSTIPEADGCVDGAPLIIAADMDIRRVEQVCTEAARLGRPEVMVAALGKQMSGLLLEVLQGYKNVTPLSIEPVLGTVFGTSIYLHDMDCSPAVDAQGGVIHV